MRCALASAPVALLTSPGALMRVRVCTAVRLAMAGHSLSCKVGTV